MASLALAQMRCGVTAVIPSGIFFACGIAISL